MASQFTTRNYKRFDLVHFTVRGFERKPIFFTDADHREFMWEIRNRIDGANEIGRPDLLAFGQMPNHQHVFMRCGHDPTVAPKILRGACTSYAIEFNRRHRTDGKVFQRPFRGRVIRGADHIMNTFAYIHLNPDASLRVDNSSHGFYAGFKDDPHIDPSLAWRVFGGREGYLEFFNDTAKLRAARRATRFRLET